MFEITWGSAEFPLWLTDELGPVTLSVAPAAGVEPARPEYRARPAAVEVLAVGHGRGLNSLRASRTSIGDRLRYLDHSAQTIETTHRLIVRQSDPVTGLVAALVVERHDGCAAYRSWVELTNLGAQDILIQQVTSASLSGLTSHLGGRSSLDLWSARSEWCAESRWHATDLGGPGGLADINTALHGHFSRGSIAQVGHSTWSSGEQLPVAGIENRDNGSALAWQIEHNGPWRWEIATLFDPADALGLALLGPTDLDHSWSITLGPKQKFTTVPATIALSDGGLTGAIRELTRHRRASHLVRHADAERPLVFNDYMNALMGDPTTEKLLPLIDAAADAGARYFCIDAGWYDDGGNWWPSVGAWEPSTVRFGEPGLAGVLDYIRRAGMTPGLWVEPEVIGVNSPVASQLPEEAFMRRGGRRIVEHDRYFLDFRSRAARAYLDEVFARLVQGYGARYFKWDHNVTPGTGPDAEADSPGAGLLDHARAHLTWVRQLRERYPEVILEACSSGAQRMDPAILAHYDLQSTSDQQDYRLHATIAAAAPMSMPPEQAGNWAYPQPGWTNEQVAFTLVNGLSGRLYLSGHLNQLAPEQLALVREATAVYPELIRHHARAYPSWPLGLPAWDDPQVALATSTQEETVLFVWNRSEDAGRIALDLPQFAGGEVTIEPVFPAGLAAWPVHWDAATHRLWIDLSGSGESARVLRLRRA
ncbi:MAG: alpha-galactosidase [Arachnia sp.]